MDIAQLGFQIDSSQATTATQNLDGMNAAAGRAETGTSRMARQVERDVSAVQRTMGQLGAGLAAFFSFQALTGLVRNMTRLADTWSDLTSRVQVAIGVNGNAAAVMDRLSVVARQTYSSLEKTADGFTRNATTLNALGVSTQQQLDYTQALNNALVVSGAKGQQAELVMNGLSRSMAEGAMKGDDLNLILNYGSRVAEVLAKELGTTTLGLRDMAKEGKITGSVIFNSLVKNMDLLTEQAEAMPATVGDAFTLIGNAVLRTVGAFDQQNKLSQTFAEKLIIVADSMGEIFRAGLLIAQVLATLFTARLLYSATAYTAQLGFQAALYIQNASLATMWAAANSQGILASIASIGLLKLAFGGMAAAMVGWQIGTYLREEFLQVRLFGIAMVEGILVAWENLKSGTELVWLYIEKTITESISKVRTKIADLLVAYSDFAQTDLLTGAKNEDTWSRNLAASIRPAVDATTDYAAAIKKAEKANEDAVKGVRAITGGMADYEISADLAKQMTNSAATEVTGLGVAAVGAAGEVTKATKAVKENDDALQDWLRIMDSIKGGNADLAEQIRKNKDRLAGLNEATVDYNAALREADNLQAAALATGSLTISQQEELTRAIAERKALLGEKYADDLALERMQQEASALESILSGFDNIGFDSLIGEIDRVTEALERGADAMGNAYSDKQIKRMKKAQGELRQELLEGYVGALHQGASSLQSMAREGSAAYGALTVAQQALNLATAVGAIANQGLGDPYTAFARIAAMIAAMASLGLNPGGGAGGLVDTSAQNQASQGTGSVLGDASAKSESIANSIEITADATSELVGINRGMLRALQAVQAGLSGAGGMLARGAGDQEFTNFGPAQLSSTMTALSGFSLLENLFGGITAKILGAKSKITDQGIRIVGGTLAELIENVSVGAYQEVQSRSWWFGSTRTNTQVTDLGDDVANQFQLVLNSIADTVREGARALGLNMEEIDAAIAAYEIAEIKISLKGLSGEEAQAELAAVFSEIFDGLAGDIVPFIAQFQQVGEGLGETLVRVATGVQVMREALTQLGFSLDETGPEQFAQASEGLIALAGGLEEFISGMSAFVNAFATDEHKFRVSQDAITRAFEQYGLTVPDTRDGMWALMQSLDATTESGREQIAMLLRLADTADTYYGQLEDQQERVSGLWTKYWNRFYSDSERAQREYDRTGSNVTKEFEDIGVNVLDYTGEGGAAAFRELFEKVMPKLSAEGIVQWLEAAEALGIFIDASANLSTGAGQTAAQLAAITAILDGNAWDIAGAGMTKYELAMRDLDKQYAAQQATLEANAGTLEQRNQLERDYADQIALLNAQFRKQIDDVLGANDWDLALAGMSESERQIAEVNKRFDDQIKTLRDLGATQADLDRIERQRLQTLGNLAAAQAAQAATDYDTLANSIPGMGVTMSEYQQQIAEANDWYSETVAELNRLAIAAGRSGANIDDLANAEAELDRRRGIAIQNLMDQSQALVKSLYGTINSREIERLEKSLEGRDGFMGPSASLLDFSYFADQKKLAELRKQEEEANARMERMTGVNQLVGNLGQLLNIPGQSLETLAKQFELPLDSLAADLGLSADALEKYIRDQADRANAMVTLNDTVKSSIGISNALLRQIRDGFTGDVDVSTEKMAAPDRSAKTAPVVEIAAAREEKREKERRDDAARIEKLTATVEALLEVIANNTGIAADRLANLTDRMRDGGYTKRGVA